MTINEIISELRSLCAPHISREPSGEILAHCISLGIGPGKLTLLLDEIERLKAELEAFKGVPKPTLEDIKREAEKWCPSPIEVDEGNYYGKGYRCTVRFEADGDERIGRPLIETPSRLGTYAAAAAMVAIEKNR